MPPTATKSALLAVLAIAVLLAGCGNARTVGTARSSDTTGTANAAGAAISESRQVSAFTAVELATSGTLTIEQTGSESLTVEAEDTVLPLLTSDVVDSTLVLGTREGASFSTTQPIRYRLTVDDLAGLTVSGSGDATATGVSTGSLRVDVSGSGDVTASGTADSSDVEVSGSGDYDGAELASRTARVTVSGAGDAAVHSSDTLAVEISGSGTVAYDGNPAVTQDVSGSGELVRR